MESGKIRVFVNCPKMLIGSMKSNPMCLFVSPQTNHLGCFHLLFSPFVCCTLGTQLRPLSKVHLHYFGYMLCFPQYSSKRKLVKYVYLRLSISLFLARNNTI